MKKVIKCDGGSTLAWVVIMFAVIVIFLGVIITLTNSYRNSAINSNYSKQAFLTAKSAINTVLADLNGEGILTDKLTGDDGEFDIGTISFSDASMGDARIFIIKKGSRTFIQATCTIGGDEKSQGVREELIAEIEYSDSGELPGSPGWFIKHYMKDIPDM